MGQMERPHDASHGKCEGTAGFFKEFGVTSGGESRRSSKFRKVLL